MFDVDATLMGLTGHRIAGETGDGIASTITLSLGDVLLKPDILRCLLAYIDSDDVRGVSLLDCAISDTQCLRPRFLHMLGNGELVLNGLEANTYELNLNDSDHWEHRIYPHSSPIGYLKWLARRCLYVRFLSLDFNEADLTWLDYSIVTGLHTIALPLIQ
jgi:hypothetical protein